MVGAGATVVVVASTVVLDAVEIFKTFAVAESTTPVTFNPTTFWKDFRAR